MSQLRIDPTLADYDGTVIDDLSNAIFLRVMTPLGQYWADPTLGSRLHELQREKDVARVATLGEQYMTQCLQPLLDDGRAAAITVTSERQPSRLALLASVRSADGKVAEFTRYLQVS